MVMDFYDQGRLQEIRNYCETDVLNSFLLYLIYQHHNGSMSRDSFAKCKKSLVEFLEEKSVEKPHFREFLQALAHSPN
jgi:hypothetical protein